MTPLKEAALLTALDNRKTVQFFTVATIVSAIQEAAIGTAQGKTDFGKTRSNIKTFQDLLYPDLAVAAIDKTEQTRRILEKEHARGPMKVQALDYSKRKKKKRR